MASAKNVAVLMSAYNGVKYIGEQLESVCNQSFPNVEIYVRDDGSTDGTLGILKKYAEKRKLTLFCGENKGFVRSYFTLLRNSPKVDYYAWCDQDDVWRKWKLQRAIDKIEEAEKKFPSVPILYFSDYDFYDSNLSHIGKGLDYKMGPSFANALMDCIPLGITCVFNRKARDMMVEHTPKFSCGQDWWVYLLCEGLGKVIYDRGHSSVKYRRLKTSVSPAGRGFWKFQWYRIHKFFIQGYFKNVRKQLWEFAKYYRNDLNAKDRKLLDLFTREHYSLLCSLKKTFYPVRFRQNIIDEILLRVLFLVGRL